MSECISFLQLIDYVEYNENYVSIDDKCKFFFVLFDKTKIFDKFDHSNPFDMNKLTTFAFSQKVIEKHNSYMKKICDVKIKYIDNLYLNIFSFISKNHYQDNSDNIDKTFIIKKDKFHDCESLIKYSQSSKYGMKCGRKAYDIKDGKWYCGYHKRNPVENM